MLVQKNKSASYSRFNGSSRKWGVKEAVIELWNWVDAGAADRREKWNKGLLEFYIGHVVDNRGTEPWNYFTYIKIWNIIKALRKACWTVKDGVTVGQLLSSTWQSPLLEVKTWWGKRSHLLMYHLPRKLIWPSDIVNPHLDLRVMNFHLYKNSLGLLSHTWSSSSFSGS